jgi:hypothetical protein
MKYIEIDGKKYLWRDLLKLRSGRERRHDGHKPFFLN